MQPTETELLAAYERTGLSRIGYSFEKAMDCEVTKKCLVRMALNAKKNVTEKVIGNSSRKAVMATQPPYWWQKY